MAASKETLPSSERRYNEESLREAGQEHLERLDETRRDKAEKAKETSVEKARHDIEKAQEQEKKPETQEKHTDKVEKRDRDPTKRDRELSYHKVMHEAERHMSPAERNFSRFIHHPAVEKASETLGSTVARPNAILYGALFAFIFTLAIYLVARQYGYPLSGGETFVSFLVGWVFGMLFDYIRLLVTGKRS